MRPSWQNPDAETRSFRLTSAGGRSRNERVVVQRGYEANSKTTLTTNQTISSGMQFKRRCLHFA